jgi:NAD-dependent deacetylase
MMEEYIKLADLIKRSSNVIVLTGAGISTDSGIPDFRGPKGLYSQMNGEYELSTDVLLNDPKRFYKVGFKLLADISQAKPNRAHYILADWEKRGRIKGVITQNIDGLHNIAGSNNIIEVHGNLRQGICTDCGYKVTFEQIKELIDKGQIPPLCNQCGGILRPSVILFGDIVTDFDKAYNMAYKSDLMIVLGSSLEVAPVSFLPRISKKLAIINIGNTPYNFRADVVIKESISQVLEQINEILIDGER